MSTGKKNSTAVGSTRLKPESPASATKKSTAAGKVEKGKPTGKTGRVGSSKATAKNIEPIAAVEQERKSPIPDVTCVRSEIRRRTASEYFARNEESAAPPAKLRKARSANELAKLPKIINEDSAHTIAIELVAKIDLVRSKRAEANCLEERVYQAIAKCSTYEPDRKASIILQSQTIVDSMAALTVSLEELDEKKTECLSLISPPKLRNCKLLQSGKECIKDLTLEKLIHLRTKEDLVKAVGFSCYWNDTVHEAIEKWQCFRILSILSETASFISHINCCFLSAAVDRLAESFEYDLSKSSQNTGICEFYVTVLPEFVQTLINNAMVWCAANLKLCLDKSYTRMVSPTLSPFLKKAKFHSPRDKLISKAHMFRAVTSMPNLNHTDIDEPPVFNFSANSAPTQTSVRNQQAQNRRQSVKFWSWLLYLAKGSGISDAALYSKHCRSVPGLIAEIIGNKSWSPRNHKLVKSKLRQKTLATLPSNVHKSAKPLFFTEGYDETSKAEYSIMNATVQEAVKMSPFVVPIRPDQDIFDLNTGRRTGIVGLTFGQQSTNNGGATISSVFNQRISVCQFDAEEIAEITKTLLTDFQEFRKMHDYISKQCVTIIAAICKAVRERTKNSLSSTSEKINAMSSNHQKKTEALQKELQKTVEVLQNSTDEHVCYKEMCNIEDCVLELTDCITLYENSCADFFSSGQRNILAPLVAFVDRVEGILATPVEAAKLYNKLTSGQLEKSLEKLGAEIDSQILTPQSSIPESWALMDSMQVCINNALCKALHLQAHPLLHDKVQKTLAVFANKITSRCESEGEEMWKQVKSLFGEFSSWASTTCEAQMNEWRQKDLLLQNKNNTELFSLETLSKKVTTDYRNKLGILFSQKEGGRRRTNRITTELEQYVADVKKTLTQCEATLDGFIRNGTLFYVQSAKGCSAKGNFSSSKKSVDVVAQRFTDAITKFQQHSETLLSKNPMYKHTPSLAQKAQKRVDDLAKNFSLKLRSVYDRIDHAYSTFNKVIQKVEDTKNHITTQIRKFRIVAHAEKIRLHNLAQKEESIVAREEEQMQQMLVCNENDPQQCKLILAKVLQWLTSGDSKSNSLLKFSDFAQHMCNCEKVMTCPMEYQALVRGMLKNAKKLDNFIEGGATCVVKPRAKTAYTAPKTEAMLHYSLPEIVCSGRGVQYSTVPENKENTNSSRAKSAESINGTSLLWQQYESQNDENPNRFAEILCDMTELSDYAGSARQAVVIFIVSQKTSTDALRLDVQSSNAVLVSTDSLYDPMNSSYGEEQLALMHQVIYGADQLYVWSLGNPILAAMKAESKKYKTFQCKLDARRVNSRKELILNAARMTTFAVIATLELETENAKKCALDHFSRLKKEADCDRCVTLENHEKRKSEANKECAAAKEKIAAAQKQARLGILFVIFACLRGRVLADDRARAMLDDSVSRAASCVANANEQISDGAAKLQKIEDRVAAGAAYAIERMNAMGMRPRGWAGHSR